MKSTHLVATMTEPPTGDGEALRALGGSVSVLEVRADRVGDLDADWLRDRFRGTLIYTLRSQSEGGDFSGAPAERQARVAAQVGRYDLIDLEVDCDGIDALLAVVPESARILSWHGHSWQETADPSRELEARFTSMQQHPARFHKMIPTASRERDSVRVLAALAALQARGQAGQRASQDNPRAVIFAGGPIGAWTRLLAPHLGSALTYGALTGAAGAPGQPTIEQLVGDYGLPALPNVERLFGIAGCPVAHSLSPRLHNGAYRALGISALYVPFHVETFDSFWRDVVQSNVLDRLGFPLSGLSVTAPHKEIALARSDAASARARHVGAANTLVRTDGERAGDVWKAETTDPAGVIGALESAGVRVHERSAAVVGCGGAGRAAAYGLERAGARVTLVNRSEARGREAAELLALPFEPLDTFRPETFDVLVHATSLGRAGDPLPFSVRDFAEQGAENRADGTPRTVLDLVYGHQPTLLLRQAAAAGARTVDGREVLLHQALSQFEEMTGRALEPSLARALLAGSARDGSDDEANLVGQRPVSTRGTRDEKR